MFILQKNTILILYIYLHDSWGDSWGALLERMGGYMAYGTPISYVPPKFAQVNKNINSFSDSFCNVL